MGMHESAVPAFEYEEVVRCTYPCLLLLQVLVSVTAVVSQAGIMVGMLWAIAGGMVHGRELGTRPTQCLSMRIVYAYAWYE